MNHENFDLYFEKVMPLVATVAMMKTFLAEEIAKTAVTEIQKSKRRRLTGDERKVVQTAADAVVAGLNPDVFELDPAWSPKSPNEVKEKLIELKLETQLTEKLTADVIRTFREAQAGLHDFR